MLTRLPFIAALALGLLGATAESQSPQASQSGIVGQWEGDTFAAGNNAGITLNLYPNGTYSKRVVTVMHFGWTLDGNTLLIAPVTAISGDDVTFGKAVGMNVTLMGDSLVASAEGQSLLLRRVTWPVANQPLVGRWEGQSDLNEPITQDFMDTGRLILTIARSREAGRYTIKGESINWQEQIPNPERRRSRFKLEKGKMLLYISPKLPPIELNRVDPNTAKY
ncbi:MAG: hypothetical protein ABI681_13240 [Gemmatimonadales bacterium]